MLFFKPKARMDELMPPPPPSPDKIEGEKPKFFDTVVNPEKEESFPEEKDFSGLFEELAPKKAAKKASLKMMGKQKLAKLLQKKSGKQKAAKPKEEFPEPDMLEGYGLEEFKLPEELKDNNINLPETLENFDESLNIGAEEERAKPKEVLDAEEEIKSAMESIKKGEKPSFFKRFFAKKELNKKQEYSEEEMPALQESDSISAIQNKIKETRNSLMGLDLEAAKRNYIEIMKIYNRINPEEQAKVYNDIRGLYFERKSAEELKV